MAMRHSWRYNWDPTYCPIPWRTSKAEAISGRWGYKLGCLGILAIYYSHSRGGWNDHHKQKEDGEGFPYPLLTKSEVLAQKFSDFPLGDNPGHRRQGKEEGAHWHSWALSWSNDCPPSSVPGSNGLRRQGRRGRSFPHTRMNLETLLNPSAGHTVGTKGN